MSFLRCVFDLLLQDAEDDACPSTARLESGLAEDAFLAESIAPQGVHAEDVVLVHFGLDAPQSQHVHAIVRDEFTCFDAEIPAALLARR